VQNLIPNNAEHEVGMSLIVISDKTLPSLLDDYPVLIFYVTIVYTIFKLLRSGLVPQSVETVILDAPFPDDILMLCETINLYRVKGNFEKEEELYFLLVDIMRNP